METNVQLMNNTLNTVGNQFDSQINSIYENIDNKLEKETSLIHKASVKVGSLDLDTITLPISFTVEPKRIRDASGFRK